MGAQHLLMQPTWLTCRVMVGIRLICVFCAVKNTPPHFVVNVREIIVLNVLTRFWGQKTVFEAHTFVVRQIRFCVVLCRDCCVVHLFGRALFWCALGFL